MVLVIFDIDGTLVYSNKVDSQCFADTYEEVYRKTFPTLNWAQYPHVVDTVIFKEVIKQHFQRVPDQKEMNDFQQLFAQRIEAERKVHPEKFKEVPGAKKMVDYLLGQTEFAVGIGTGGWLKPAKIKLQHVGIAPQKLFLSAADGQPSREAILQYAVDQAHAKHISFKKIVYVGDALWDVRTTRNMQMDFIGIRRNDDRRLLMEAGATQVFQNYLDPSSFLDAIKNAVPPM